MRNLKRTLSLALTAIMLLGMMIINVSAADSVYDDFTDLDEIVNKDAVNLLVNLGIVNGKEDGSYFDPAGDVTRAEMAKMIAVALNKGVDDTELYIGMNTGLTDVKGHWAEGSINFCVNRGIIAGRGDGTFDPAANVTAAEAAKMLLVAVGYDPTIEGFVGNNWAANVTAKASSLSLFDNYNGTMLATLNRDDAALLIYNALDIAMVQSYINGYAITTGIGTNSNPQTILSSVYGVLKIKGVVTANKWASLEDTANDSWSDRVDNHLIDNRTKLWNVQVYASNTVATNTASSVIDGLQKTEIANTGSYVYSRTFNVDTPVEYLGQTVTMYIRKTTILTDYEVIGVYLREVDNDVVSKDAAKSTAKSIVDKSGLTVDGGTQRFVNYGYCVDDAAMDKQLAISDGATGNGIDVTIIDNDKDGVADYILCLRRDLDVVTMSKNDVILRQYNGNKAISASDIVTDLSLATDDVVLVVTYGERYYIEEPEVVTGVMTAYDNKKVEEQTIDVDGTTYKQSGIGFLTSKNSSAHNQNDILDLNITNCNTEAGVQFKTTYEFFLDTHGNIRAYRPTEESLPNYALILESGYNPGVYASDASGKVTAVLSDGTKDTFTLNFSASASNIATQLGYANDSAGGGIEGNGFSKSDKGVIELKAFLGTDYTDNSTTRPWRYTANGAAAGEGGSVTASNNYTFAYKHGDATTVNTAVLRAQEYRAGQAAGYVIRYTLNDDNVMTIVNIIGGVSSKAVQNGNWNNFKLTDTQLNDRTRNIVRTLRTDGSILDKTYSTGNATVYLKDGATTTSYVGADRNTVAFYYDEATSKYDVRVGYPNMSTVDKDAVAGGVPVVAATAVRVDYNETGVTYKNSNVADAILFGFCPKNPARDYAFVLSANTVVGQDEGVLNVIFEDGTAGQLKVKGSEFDKFDPSVNANRDNFQWIWAYSIGSDGYATLEAGTPIIGDGFQTLRMGGHAIEVLCDNSWTADDDRGYYPYDPNTINIWDIDQMKEGQDATRVLDITRNYKEYWALFLVLDGDGNVRTAFVSDDDLFHSTHDAPPPTDHDDHMRVWNVISNPNNLKNDYKYVTSGSATEIYDEVVDLLSKGYDVRLNRTLTLYGPLNIPNGQTLYIDSTYDLIANNYNITGDGNLYVGGDLSSPRDISTANVVIMGTLKLSNNTAISSDLMYVNAITIGSNTLTINATADVHVGYDRTGADNQSDLTGTANSSCTINGTNGTLTVNGHLETQGAVNVPGSTVTVNGNMTLIVGGTLTAKTLTVTKAANEDGDPVVTVADETKVATLTGVTGTVWALEDVTITSGGAVNLAGQTVVVSGSFNASAADTVKYTNTELVVAPTSENAESGVSINLGTTAAEAPAITISNENLDAADKAAGITDVSIVVVNANGDEQTVKVSNAIGGDDSDLSGITIKLTEDESGAVTPDLGGDIVQTTLSITLTDGNSAYLTGADTDAVTVDFTKAEEGVTPANVTLSLTSAGATISVAVGGDEATEYTNTTTVTLEAAEGVNTTITVKATKDNEAVTTKTITVKGGQVSSGS